MGSSGLEGRGPFDATQRAAGSRREERAGAGFRFGNMDCSPEGPDF